VLGFRGRSVFVLFADVNEVGVPGIEQVHGFVAVNGGFGDLVGVYGPPVEVFDVLHVIGRVQERDHDIRWAVGNDDVHPVGFEDAVDLVQRSLEAFAAVFGAQQAVDGAFVQRHLYTPCLD